MRYLIADCKVKMSQYFVLLILSLFTTSESLTRKKHQQYLGKEGALEIIILIQYQFELNMFSDSDEIHSFYNKLARKKNKLVKIETIGSSIEERNIIAVKINEKLELPAVVIDAGKELYMLIVNMRFSFHKTGIHAREWISPASVMYFSEVISVISKIGSSI